MGKTRGQFRIFPSGDPGIQIVAAATDHSFPRHSHEHYGIGVICQGAQKSHSGRGMVEAGAGHVITVNPQEVHDGTPIGDAGRSWHMLYFDPAIISSAIGDMQEGASASGEFILPAMENANAAQLFRQLFRCMTAERAASSELQRQELLLRLLPALIDRPREGGAAPSAPVAIRMAQAMIDDAPLAAVTLAHLAAATGLSRFQVLRGFSRVTGLTPHAYLMQRRTDLARRLIAGGSGLADAAIASGFADQSHMTRLFVRKYGIAPGAYAAALA